MPELREYLFDPEILMKLSEAERAARNDAIEKASRYYSGDHRKPLKVRAGQADDNVIVNLTKKVIDQSVSMLFGERPEMQAPGSEADQVLADKLLEDNGIEQFMHGIGVTGALSGHVYVKLMPDPKLGVRMVSINPEYVTVFWQPDDVSRIQAYMILWKQGKMHYRQDIYQGDGGLWMIRDLQREESGAWQQTAEQVFPFPFPPLLDWQNLPRANSLYGESDITNATLNDAVNFVASNINRILKFHAHPKTMGIGIAAKDVTETAVDGFWAIQDKDAKVQNLEMQSDLSSSMAYLEYLQASFFAQHRAVDIGSLKDRLGQLTNFGLTSLFKDALDKLKSKRTLYGNGLTEMLVRMGMMMGKDWRGAEIVWPDPLPYNDMEEVQILEKEIALGIISRQTAAQLRGRDWEREQERMAAEQQAQQRSLGGALLQLLSDNGTEADRDDLSAND